MDNKILTIVIPSYNTSKYMDSTLPTILEQKYCDCIEVIIINDGSTDDTASKASMYQEMYPKTIKVVNKENGGHGSGINRGIQEASGLYFKIIDGDDYVDTNELVRLIEQLNSIDVDVFFSPYTTVSAISRVEKYMKPTDFRFVNKGLDVQYNTKYKANEILPYIYGTIHALTYKTSLLKEHFDDIRVSEKVFYEDNEYCLYPMAYVQSVYLSDCNVYKYLIDQANQSVSSENRKKRIEHQYVVVDSILEHYELLFKDHFSKETKGYADRVIGRHIYSLYETFVLFTDKLFIRTKELKEIDTKIKNRCIDGYREANIYPPVKIIRGSKYLLYGVMRYYLRKKWKLNS